MVRRSVRISGKKSVNLNQSTNTILKSTKKKSYDGEKRMPKVKWLETNFEMDVSQIDKQMIKKCKFTINEKNILKRLLIYV